MAILQALSLSDFTIFNGSSRPLTPQKVCGFNCHTSCARNTAGQGEEEDKLSLVCHSRLGAVVVAASSSYCTLSSQFGRRDEWTSGQADKQSSEASD